MPDRLEEMLRAAPVSDAVRAQAWDAYHTAGSPDEFTAAFQKMALPQSIKADLYDLKFKSQTTALTGAKSIRATTWRDRLSDAASTLPMVGGMIGGLAGGVPGAALGAAGGKGWEQTLRTLAYGRPAATGGVAQAVAGEPKPGESGGREAVRQGVDVATSAVTQGVVPELVGMGATKLLRGGFMRPPTGSLDEKLYRMNRELDLRLTSPELRASTPAGIAGQTFQLLSERSLTGRVIASIQRKVGRVNTIEGVAEGGAALKRVGAAIDDVVKSGPSFDMLPQKLAAVKVANDDIFPKILQLKDQALSPKVKSEIVAAMHGGLSPALTRSILKRVRPILTAKGQAVPAGSVDAILKILDAADDVSFESATALRTGMMELTRGGDSLLGERGVALTKEFTDQLTQGLKQVEPHWGPLTEQYRLGKEGLRATPVKSLRRSLSLEERGTEAAAVKAKTGTGAMQGNEAHSIENLRLINEALQRRKNVSWSRLYEVFELVGVGAATVKGGPVAGAQALLTLEVLPAMITWASFSPTMTKYLVEGFNAPNARVAAANLARVVAGYRAYQQQQESREKQQVQ